VALPPQYQSQESVQPPPRFSTDLPQVKDVGPAFTGIARSIMGAAEPHLREKAESQALEDAGAASIVKDPEGNYTRSNLTHGGGLVYAKAYGEALDERQLNMMSQDYATDLGNVAMNWVDDPTKQDPQAFWSFAAGKAQAMMEAAPGSIRARLDIRLARELGDRVRGFSEAVHSTQRRQMADGLSTDLKTVETDVGNLAQTDGDEKDIAKRIGDRLADGIAIIRKMKELGFIGDERPEVDSLMSRTFDERSYVAGAAGMRGFGQLLPSLTDEELARVQAWGDHVDDGGQVQGMGMDQFFGAFAGNARWIGAAGTFAGKVLSQRLEQQRHDEYLRALTAGKPKTAAEVRQELEDQRASPSTGLTGTEITALDQDYGTHGTPAQQLATPDGVVRTLGFLAQTGTVPLKTNDALLAAIHGSDEQAFAQAFSFIQQARDITTKSGSWVGLDWFRSLPGDIQAFANFDATMRRNGYDSSTRIREVLDQMRGQNLGFNKMVEIWGKEQDYRRAAHAAIAEAFGVKPAELTPEMTRRLDYDFDQLARLNVQLYPGTPEKALQATAESLTNGWARNDLFVGGIGDRRLIGLGIPTWFMDNLLKGSPSLRSANPTGALFSNGRVRIMAVGDAPADKFPDYQVIFYDQAGNRLTGARGAILPMQKVADMWGRTQAEQQRRAAAEAKANTPPARVIMGKNASGNFGFIPNPEWQKWAKEHGSKGGSKANFSSEQFNEQLRTVGYTRY
jgi:hypothetical protein